MDDTSRSVFYETLRNKDTVRRSTSTPKKLFMAHVALQKQCNRIIKYQEQQRYIEYAGLRCKMQQMERKRDRYLMEKQRIEEQRQRITNLMAELDNRRALFRRQREKTMHEIRWLERSEPSDDLRRMCALRSDRLGLRRIEKWTRPNRAAPTPVREGPLTG
ncbi:hypothetical protein LSH36_933g00037 [Paralvinella palmiformis]|uniref:Uncharacterized protein n=1 Tax=Paralvinella palmiformis TaxID=53620 RepID=A0AAD9MTN7_9ANNE|nr:hypothetical protein LSH36_933g00037 [Paralvinella palmiformis]